MEDIKNGENRFVEFKVEYTKNILKTVSAFSNYNTGKIYIGISDDGDIIGIDNFKNNKIKLEQSINDSITPIPYFEIEDCIINKKTIIILTVYKGENTPYRYREKAYKRTDSSTIVVDNNALK